MNHFSQIPNIGKELAKKLTFAEVSSPEELKFLGSKEGLSKDKNNIPWGITCINMLYALEGAIQNIRWHKLDKGIKADLLDFYQSLKMGQNHH